VWVKRFQESREGYQDVVGWNPFDGWELDTAPESAAEDKLLDAVEILYGRGDADLAQRFLERGLEITERTLAEGKLLSPLCQDHAPQNQGDLLRARTYSLAMLGKPVDEASLLAASAAIEEACAKHPRGNWDDYEEAKYLSAVRLALLGGSAQTTQRLLQQRRAFRSHVEEHELLQALTTALSAGVPVRDEAFKSRFDAYFDQVRDPDYDPEEYSRVPILRLEIGLLRDKYLISPDGQIDWQRAIDAIAV
jgi:hypothetical protein